MELILEKRYEEKVLQLQKKPVGVRGPEAGTVQTLKVTARPALSETVL